jgi:2-keto-3-deoxy-L-rhamnonate aldolase RhmA
MERRRIRLGGWLSTAEPLIVEAVGRAGYDWVGIDLQHGAWDVSSAARGIQLLDLLNVPVLARVSDEELPLIPHVLDQGASGIVIAMTSSPETVAAAIARARYHPEGQRSYGGQRYGMRHEPDDVATIRPAIYAMLETREAVERIAEIVAVPGIAGIHVGPVDLRLSLGVGRGRASPAFDTALQKIVDTTHAADLPAVMHAVAQNQVSEMIELGFDELVLTAEIGLLRQALADEIANARNRIEDAAAANARKQPRFARGRPHRSQRKSD